MLEGQAEITPIAKKKISFQDIDIDYCRTILTWRYTEDGVLTTMDTSGRIVRVVFLEDRWDRLRAWAPPLVWFQVRMIKQDGRAFRISTLLNVCRVSSIQRLISQMKYGIL